MRLSIVIAVSIILSGCAAVEEAPEPTQGAEIPFEVPLNLNAEVEALRSAVAAAVANGTAVDLAAKPVYEDLVRVPRSQQPVAHTVVLERDTRFLTNETWIEAPANVTVGLDAVELFEGHVEGDEAQIVRLAIGPDWARGSIRDGDMQHILRLGLANNIPVTSPLGSGKALRMADVIPATFDGPTYRDHDCLSLAPTDLTPMAEIGHSQKSPLVTDMILDADTEFAAQLGLHSIPMMIAMFYENDAIYQYETGINFEIRGIHIHDDYTFEVNPDADFDGLSAYWNARTDDRDIVHMFTGSESSYAQANCIGGAGVPEEAYTFTPLNWEHEYEIFHLTALAHELGHIFNAHHHYGNHAEANGELATLMIQGYTPGVNPVFSTVSKTTIRGWAEAYVQ